MRIYLTKKAQREAWKKLARETDLEGRAERTKELVAELGDAAPAGDDDAEVILTRSQPAATSGPRLKTIDDAMAFLKGADDDERERAREDLGGMERAAIPVVISDDSEDRDRDIVVPTGIDLAEFRKNPVMLFGHNHGIPAIGNGFGTHSAGNEVRSIATFNPKDVDPFGFMIGRMFEERIMRAISIGFIPREWTFETDRGPLAMRFLQSELIEFSGVNVGSNRNALTQARGVGIDVRPGVDLLGRMLDEGKGGAAAEETWRLVAPQRAFSIPALKAEVGELRAAEEVAAARAAARAEPKGAISYGTAHRSGTPIAARGAEWDGAAEVAAAGVDDLRVMSAWFDSEAADAKESYKLPHHRANVDHTLVWRGVTAAMGALLGARGGVDIPSADRRSVYNHLARHYRDDFDAEPPEFKAVSEDEAKAIAEAPYPSDVTDWLGVAVSLGRELGPDAFSRAVRANTYGRSAEEQAARKKDAGASQAGAAELLSAVEHESCAEEDHDEVEVPQTRSVDKPDAADDDGAQQTGHPVDFDRLIALAERRLR